MTPLTRRRLQNFRANRRGYASLWLFSVLFLASLFAEFIANDKPIVFSLGGELHFPVWFTYSEAELGGELETEAFYRDPYVMDLIEADGWALWPPVRFSHNTIDWGIADLPSPPDADHILGTDGGATDVFA